MEPNSYDMRLAENFTCIVAAPSGAGKTVLVLKILAARDELFKQDVNIVIFFYKQWQNIYAAALNAGHVDIFIQGMPTPELIEEHCDKFKNSGGSVVVVDDFMTDKKDMPTITDLFTVSAHHKKICTFFLSQNLFSKNKEFREISLNSSYLLALKNPR